MFRSLAALVVVALILGTSAAAHAQGFLRNRIINSGNGVQNAIAISNRGFVPSGAAFPAPIPNGYVQPGPRFPLLQGLRRVVGGLNVNVIENSGNGIGNSIRTTNAGAGGVNLNVIRNSGNGANNSIGISNRR